MERGVPLAGVTEARLSDTAVVRVFLRLMVLNSTA